MAGTELVASKIEAGRQLLAELDRRSVLVGSAFWRHDAESGSWRLVLSMPSVRTNGVAETYRFIAEALKEIPGPLFARDIEPVAPDDAIVQGLRKVMPPRRIDVVHLSGTTIADTLIDDVIVYRST
jgi:hypothetical protein